MLRKKNYKDEDHFTQYYSAVVTKNNGSRLTIYYKRYRPQQVTQTSVYSALHGNNTVQPKPEYPVDRTL
jgi:hypothetical protein